MIKNLEFKRVSNEFQSRIYTKQVKLVMNE